MKKNCIMLIALLSVSIAKAQPCLPDGITFSNQAQLDSFQVNYPNCNQIDGNVIISGIDITNLNGLSSINTIIGNLGIWDNQALTNLTGLENLVTIGGIFTLEDNDALISLSGLQSLASIGGDLKIGVFDMYSGGHGNSLLTNLSGLGALTSVGKSLQIQFNASLNNLTGTENLTSVGESLIIHNNWKLTDLSGLEGLTTINELLSIRENDSLTDLSGLENLNHINGYLYIADNLALTDLTGLDGLIAIDSGLSLDNNDALISLTALASLENIGKTIWIAKNDNLSHLSGLDNINQGSISDLSIYDNLSLSTCNVQSICNYLINQLGTVEIHDNATGCDNNEEIVAACTFGLKENGLSECQFYIYPNPASTEITVESSRMQYQIQMAILNMNGQVLNHYCIKEPITNIDISHLLAGVYFLKLTFESKIRMFKVVKY